MRHKFDILTHTIRQFKHPVFHVPAVPQDCNMRQKMIKKPPIGICFIIVSFYPKTVKKAKDCKEVLFISQIAIAQVFHKL